MLKIVFLLCLTLASRSNGQQQGACYKPFSEFLTCMKGEAQNRIDTFVRESSSSVQNGIQGCFRSSGCALPNFQGATLSKLLPMPWSKRTHILVDLIETSPSNVQSCMIDFFIEQARNHIQSCINKHGAGTHAQHFTFPPLPKFDRLNIGVLKNSVLNRILVTESSINCAKQVSQDSKLQQTLSCIHKSRADSLIGACQKRDQCKKNVGSQCTPAFNSVQSASCACFQAEKEQFMNGNLQNFKSIIDLFLKGGLTNQYKQCCAKYNVPAPQAKLNEITESIRAMTRDVLVSGLPTKVQQISAQMITQISEEVEKLLCGECSAAVDNNGVVKEAASLRALARSNGSGQNTLSKGLLSVLG